MSYYILPKYSYESINIEPTYLDELTMQTQISPSLIYYLNNILLQLNNPGFFPQFIKINSLISPYKYIYSKIPNYNIPISKLNLSQASYIYIELIQLCNLLENTNTNTPIHCININNFLFSEVLSYLKNDEYIHHNFIDLNTNLPTLNSADIINIDLSQSFTHFNDYIISVCNSLCYIFKNQKQGGVSIIKIDHIFYKPIIDILFILNVLYEKIYIVKPNVSSIIKNELYIVCKSFKIVPLDISKLQDIKPTAIISSLICDKLPYYFLNKIEEANIIIYHQKIQYIDQINNILINKSKMDTIKKNNIQKCILWCDKYKIPSNKITDKVNIFLSSPVEDIFEIDEIEPINISTLINNDLVDNSSFSKQYELLNIFNVID